MKFARELLFFGLIFVAVLLSCQTEEVEQASDSSAEQSSAIVRQPFEGEVFFGTIHQLTNGGENAEAYFNTAGDRLIFQSTRGGRECDLIYSMKLDGSDVQLISPEGGRTTCSFIGGDNDFIIYSSTHHLSTTCPEAASSEGGYVWMLYNYDIFRRNYDGSELVNLTNSDSYDAEGIVSPDGEEIVFSSTRTGDQEIFLMNADGSNVRQLTDTLGYDGGPFYSWDGSKIIFRSYRPDGDEEVASYKAAMAEGKMLRVPLELYIMDSDGSNMQQLTDLGASSFAPFMHPNGKQVIFCSNYGGRPWVFNLFVINVDGSGLEQVTFSESFDGFPMFSKDGKYLVWCANRHAEVATDTNVFITEWQQ